MSANAGLLGICVNSMSGGLWPTKESPVYLTPLTSPNQHPYKNPINSFYGFLNLPVVAVVHNQIESGVVR